MLGTVNVGAKAQADDEIIASKGALTIEDDGTLKLKNQLAEVDPEAGDLDGYATESYVQEQVKGVTPASIGAAAASHTHTPASIGAAAASHNHSASEINSGTLPSDRLPTVPVSKGGTGKTSVTSGNFLVGNGTGAMTEKTPAQVLAAIGAAPAYTYGTTDLTAGTSELATGTVHFVYE